MTSTRPSILQVWWLAIRPKTLAAGIIPVVVASALAWRDGAASVWVMLLCLVTTLSAQIGTNLHNDYCDFVRGADNDERVGPDRAAQKGWLTLAQLRSATWIAFSISMMAGLPMVVRGGWSMLVLGVIGILAGLAYTGGPRPLAYEGGGDITVLVFFGLVFVGGVYYLHTLQFTADAFWAGLAMGLLATAILVVNNLRDRETDARAGKRTLVVRYGLVFGWMEYTVCVLGAFVALAFLAWADGSMWLTWLGLPIGLGLIKAIWVTPPARLNPYLGKTAALLALEGALLSIAAAW